MKEIVIDASVVLKWYLADEELYKAVERDLNWVVWLEDYKYPDNKGRTF